VQQLTCVAAGTLEWRDVPESIAPGAHAALVRPVVVARCEIDPLLITSGPTTAEGFAVGHEAIAEVITVGSGVTDVRPGDLVASSFQVCCGQCPTCTSGRTALCEAYPILSDYGMQPLSGVEYGGMLSDLVLVPHADAMLAPIHSGVDPVTIASIADNVADGYRAVAPHLRAQPGADVLIVCHGGRSIALYATLAALYLGAGSVTFESDDAHALAVAADLGATAVTTDFKRRHGRWPIVVDCGARVEGFAHAVDSTAPEGTLHSVSYYAEPVPMSLGKLYTKGIRFYTGRVHSAAALPELLGLLESGFDPGRITPTVIAWDDAATGYLDDAIKLVVVRDR
jgi:alcohol dehydrogenase